MVRVNLSRLKSRVLQLDFTYCAIIFSNLVIESFLYFPIFEAYYSAFNASSIIVWSIFHQFPWFTVWIINIQYTFRLAHGSWNVSGICLTTTWVGQYLIPYQICPTYEFCKWIYLLHVIPKPGTLLIALRFLQKFVLQRSKCWLHI